MSQLVDFNFTTGAVFCLERHFLDPCNVTRWVTGLVPVKALCFFGWGIPWFIHPRPIFGLWPSCTHRRSSSLHVTCYRGIEHPIRREGHVQPFFKVVPSMAKVAVPNIWLIRVCSRLVNSHKCVEDIESIPHLHIKWYRLPILSFFQKQKLKHKTPLSHHWKAAFFPSFEAPWASDRFWSTFWTRRPCESLAGFDVLCQVECPSLASDWGTWEDL